MVPSWGFSLAVSGRTMPERVISSRSFALMTTRSASGCSLVAALGLLAGFVAVAMDLLAQSLAQRADR
jgi:hypothetical protein